MMSICSVMSLLTPFTVLVIAVIAYGDNLPTNYPGLTLAKARCPEEPSDPDFWHLSEQHKIPLCFGRYPLPAKINSGEDLVAACQKKHKNAQPLGAYDQERRTWLQNYKLFGYSGLHKADYLNYLNGSTHLRVKLPIEASNAYVICSVDAYPRVLSSYNRTVEPYPDLSLYKCEGSDWELQSLCGGKPFCYKVLPYPKDVPYKESDEFNRCGLLEPNSFPASIHCDAEFNYLSSKYRSGHQIGYQLPKFSIWNKFDSWQNVDGTPADYAPWASFEPNNYFGFYENIALLTAIGIGDNALPFSFGFNLRTLCKKPAVKKTVPLDVKEYESFTLAEGKQCRKEKPAHWNHRCPAGRDSWRIVESEAGVHCYDFAPLPVPLTKDNFNNDICKQLHPNAKLASFHNDVQVGLIHNVTDITTVVVGLLYEDSDFSWADETPVNKSFFASNEQVPSSDSIAHFKLFNVCPGCDANHQYNRPLLVAKPMGEVTSDMQVACKIEAEPLLDCTPLPDANPMASLDNTECEPGWSKQRFCGNVYCYKEIDIPQFNRYWYYMIENDMCAMLYPESHLASVHCVEEHYYIQSLTAESVLGLHVPENLQNNKTFDVSTFSWTDGSPVDFVGWNRFSNKRISTENKQEPLFPVSPVSGKYKPGYVAYNRHDDGSSGWTNIDYGYHRAICKAKATLKH